MTPPLPEGPPGHFLHPCTLCAYREERQVATILGSCIAVCLWDPVLEAGGMNHFMLPFWNGDGLPTPKFGNIAMEALLERMLGLGCRRERLVAKVFGGARVLNGAGGLPFSVGERNAAVALDLLGSQRIQVAVAETGGFLGVKILFNTRTGIVLAKRITSDDPASRAVPGRR